MGCYWLARSALDELLEKSKKQGKDRHNENNDSNELMMDSSIVAGAVVDLNRMAKCSEVINPEAGADDADKDGKTVN
jgi:hypothetical protein